LNAGLRGDSVFNAWPGHFEYTDRLGDDIQI
jgi:hypothetical protein